MTPPVLIARCPEHGFVRLFDGRTCCPREVPGRWAGAVWKLPEECLIPLELVPMVPVADATLELRERRSCLVGAKQTMEMVAATLANAESLDIVLVSLDVPVRERVDLLDQAVANTDAALARFGAEGER